MCDCYQTRQGSNKIVRIRSERAKLAAWRAYKWTKAGGVKSRSDYIL